MTELRPYQKEAVEAFLRSDGHASLAMAPGSGKSITACAIIRRLRDLEFDQYCMLDVLVIVPTLILKDQWEKVLLSESIGSVKIVTYAWASQHADEENFWSTFDILIWDEFHHLGYGQSFRQLLIPAHKAMYSLGLSATPPLPVDGEENIAVRVMPVVYEYSFSDGRLEGYVSPIEVRVVEVHLTASERERYDQLTGMIREMMARYGDSYHNKPYGKDAETGETIWGATITNERRQLVALAEQKYLKLKELVDEVLPKTNGRIFIWSSYVEALEKAKALLNRCDLCNGTGRTGPDTDCIRCEGSGKARHTVAEMVTGKTPKKERRRIIEEAWGRDFPVLLVANVGNEGLDAPEAAVGIVLAGAKTRRETVQRLGRLLRPQENKRATLYLLFCERSSDEKMIPLFDLATE